MAIPWFTVLKVVPWADVIANAPKVAEGAKKLWKTVGGKPATPDEHAAFAAPIGKPAVDRDDALPRLLARTAALEARVADLHEQMRASSELIGALAEQNTQLVRQLELVRRRLRWLGLAAPVLGIVALFGLGLALLR